MESQQQLLPMNTRSTTGGRKLHIRIPTGDVYIDTSLNDGDSGM